MASARLEMMVESQRDLDEEEDDPPPPGFGATRGIRRNTG
jgi:hypothetical protein